MKISHYIQTTDFCSELSSINQLLNHAVADVTFSGKRVIKVAGYEGSVCIDKIAKKVYNAGYTLFKNDSFTIEKRIAGINIVTKLRELLHEIDIKTIHLDKLSKKVKSVRELVSKPYPDSYYIANTGLMHFFTLYRECNYLSEYGFAKDDLQNYPHTHSRRNNDLGQIITMNVSEQFIRNKFISPVLIEQA